MKKDTYIKAIKALGRENFDAIYDLSLHAAGYDLDINGDDIVEIMDVEKAILNEAPFTDEEMEIHSNYMEKAFNRIFGLVGGN